MNLGGISGKGDIYTSILGIYMIQPCGYGMIMGKKILEKIKYNYRIYRSLKMCIKWEVHLE